MGRVTERRRIVRIRDGRVSERTDTLAGEEPMEIRVNGRPLAVTMRTPGDDFDLAAGLLYAEWVVRSREDLLKIRYCTDPDLDADQRYNVVTVDLNSSVLPEIARRLPQTSACGVCGKESLDALSLRGCTAVPPGPQVTADVLYALPERLREAQGVFERTGGLHAAGLFDARGELVALREDVGRHNAVDKVVGWALLEERLPLHEHVLMVSGRASFEIMQKALVAGLPVVCAVSAPSSLAVDVAQRFDMTLIGFLRDRRANVYAGAERIPVGEERSD
jgi:FdhD protein